LLNEGVLVTFTLPPFPGGILGALINGELHLQWSGQGLSDPCASVRVRVTALEDELNQLYDNIPGTKAGIPGVVEAAERRVQAWHVAHDEEVAQLRQQLAACETTRGLGSAVALSGAEPAEERTPEKRLQELLDKLPPARAQLAIGRTNEVKSIPRVSEDRETPMQRPATALTLPDGEVTREPVRDAVIPNPEKTQLDHRRQEILYSI